MRAVDTRGALFLRVGRHGLIHVVEENLRIWCIVRRAPIPPMMVAVSGGVDSMALLTLLAALRERSNEPPSLSACCVHHHLRPEADAELEAVHSHCELLGVPFYRRDVYPAAEPGNLAAAARRLRYEALADAAIEAGATAVATAHHADDQLETVLMALCRGTGVAGLSGMRWRRPLEDSMVLVRPMLDVPRRQIVEFARDVELRWHEDASNLDPSTARGMLRQEVIPRLLAHWPNAARHAAHASDAVEGVTGVFRMAAQDEAAESARRREAWEETQPRAAGDGDEPVSPADEKGVRSAPVEDQGESLEGPVGAQEASTERGGSMDASVDPSMDFSPMDDRRRLTFDLGGVELDHPEVVPYLLRVLLPPGAHGDVRQWAVELLSHDMNARVYDAGPEWELHIQGSSCEFKVKAARPDTP